MRSWRPAVAAVGLVFGCLVLTPWPGAAHGGTLGPIAGAAHDATGGVHPDVTAERASLGLMEKCGPQSPTNEDRSE
jgi:hypothetical protein